MWTVTYGTTPSLQLVPHENDDADSTLWRRCGLEPAQRNKLQLGKKRHVTIAVKPTRAHFNQTTFASNGANLKLLSDLSVNIYYLDLPLTNIIYTVQ